MIARSIVLTEALLEAGQQLRVESFFWILSNMYWTVATAIFFLLLCKYILLNSVLEKTEGKDPKDIHAGEKFGVCSFYVIFIKIIAKKVCFAGIYLVISM